MSTRVIKRTRDPLETLERMLQKTTLTTQRLTHSNIIEIGSKLLSHTTHDDVDDREKAIREAVEEAESRAARVLRAALSQLRHEKDQERQRSLEKQKLYYEKLAERVAEVRNEAEEERAKELVKKLHKEQEAALREQWEHCQELQREAVEAARAAVRKQIREELAMEKERAIAEALRIAREGFKKREQEVISKTKYECEELARVEAERVAKVHQAEVDRLSHRYEVLNKKYQKELSHKQRVEEDFMALQDDYRRFMDYTDGRYHSDYMMRLRHLGLRLAARSISTVTYEDLEELSSTGSQTH
ncbi:uncharacterized abhydrolase domain-containing protein DDB_G0269086-like [Pomacea canaliculata]|uniref:uncharacterized abhydrolase domain-containing protein DDB_G0269086-like n=1 Tax=Pomacea canaliculata TaxID=400727 RepID=UPI000D73544F|nr:uncharacterized abhydrolase domain-containing protein DDB_G0269086-like [Pomacea canaliculata]